MEYAIGPLAKKPFEIIGRIRLPMISWNPVPAGDTNKMIISEQAHDIFYGELSASKIPQIIPNESAFYLELYNGLKPGEGAVISSKILLVTSVESYKVIPTDPDNPMINLTFRYKVIEMNSKSTDIPVVESVISHIIIPTDTTCVLFIEGDKIPNAKLARAFNVFRHGDKIYHAKRSMHVVNSASDVLNCTVVVGSTDELADSADLPSDDWLYYIAQKLYGGV